MTGQARKERQALRRIQAQKVMPHIGPLLDAWDGLPNDLATDPELAELAKIVRKIEGGMEHD